MSAHTTMTDLAVPPPSGTPDKPGTPTLKPVKRNQSNKRPRFTRKPYDSKASYQQAQIPASLSIAPRQSHYCIFTSSNQIPLISQCVYASLCARIRTLGEVISLAMFKYVVSIAWYSRLVEVSRYYGTCFPVRSSDLVTAGRSLLMPTVICKYIEVLGEVSMACGASALPYCASYRDLIPIASEWFYDPLEAIQEGGRPDPHTEWSLDEAWVTAYIQAASRILRNGVEMRHLSKEMTGSQELLVGYQRGEEGLTQPVSNERLTTAVGELGAAFGLRDYDLQAEWPFGDNYAIPHLFNGSDINPDWVISALASGTYVPRST